MQEIKVLVPSERVPDFYKWFGAWLEGFDQAQVLTDVTGGVPGGSVERTPWANTPEDRELAKTLWPKLSSRAEAFFGYLMDRPGEKFRGEELATILDIPNGVYGVAGVLAHPGRFCFPLGKKLPSQYDEDGYWMEPDVAKMFREVRG